MQSPPLPKPPTEHNDDVAQPKATAPVAQAETPDTAEEVAVDTTDKPLVTLSGSDEVKREDCELSHAENTTRKHKDSSSVQAKEEPSTDQVTEETSKSQHTGGNETISSSHDSLSPEIHRSTSDRDQRQGAEQSKSEIDLSESRNQDQTGTLSPEAGEASQKTKQPGQLLSIATQEHKKPPSSPPQSGHAEGAAEQTAQAVSQDEQVETHSQPASEHLLETTPIVSPPLPEKERSLPLPPLPSKTDLSGGAGTDVPAADEELKAVARAFGVEGEANNDSSSSKPANISQTPTLDVSPTAPMPLPKTPTSAGLRIGKGPPPPGSPSEERPFDFNRFLEQMKDPSAKGVGEYVRSFIRGFAKKPYRTADQIKLIFDFLDFIATRMKQCSVWASLSENDFDNAKEAMEKLVMNRLYSLTFTPAVAKEGKWTPQTDDLERDRVLAQRIELFGWLKEEHLDVPTGDHSRGFIDFAMQELLKINHYKAPRDKLICILNCCKVIFGLIRHLGSDENADTFVPILIFVVLKANPEHLISNVEYIGRFRDPAKLSSESGYYLSSLMGATAFIETMDYSSLSNITQDEFEKNVEDAVAKVGSRPPPSKVAASGLLAPQPRSPQGKPGHHRAVSASDPHAPPVAGEEAARTLSGPGISGAPNFAEDTKAFLQRTGEAARVGFTNSLGKPIGALGKLLGEGLDGIRTPNGGLSTPMSASNSGGASPARVDSPMAQNRPPIQQQQQQQGPRRGVFSGLFSQDSREQTEGEASGSGVSGFNPASWSRSFRPGGAYDDEEPQTPVTTEHRQGPFSSLVRNPDYSNVPPVRKIGEVPFAPPHRQARQQSDGPAPRKPPPPQRMDSLDPFNSPDPSSGGAGESSSSGRSTFTGPQPSSLLRRGSEFSEGIGTPSDNGSEDEDEEGLGDRGKSALSKGLGRRLPDLGAFVPSFLTETPAPAGRSGYPGEEQRLRRGPDQGRAALPGHSSLAPSSDGLTYSEAGDESTQDLSVLSADVERVHAEQMQAAVETLRSVFPDTDDEVRRMVLEACDGDVATAIDRLLEMQSGA